jgi:hypothetical protein
MNELIKVPSRPRWQQQVINGYKAKIGTSAYYGDDWVLLSMELRKKYKCCQWCDKYFKQRELAGHHIGCVKFNSKQILDRRIILVVCNDCHKLLEPWSRINLTQMLPQIFEA